MQSTERNEELQFNKSGLKTEGVVGSGLKIVVSFVLKVQQTEAYSNGLRVSIPTFLFNYIQVFLFLKSHHLGMCSHLKFRYIIGYDNIS